MKNIYKEKSQAHFIGRHDNKKYKKITDVIGSKKVRDEVVSKTIDNNWTGLIKTEKNWHLSSFDKRSRIGATSTTKNRKTVRSLS